ncbi:MAG: Wzy polymerase domain-containing protein [Pseudomonadota bacterium]
MAWLTPNHYPPWLTFHAESLVFTALILYAVALSLGTVQLQLHPIWWLISALLVIIGAQWMSGMIAYSGDALVSGLYLLGFALAWQLGFNVASDPRCGEKIQDLIASVIVTAAAFSVYAALAQWLDQEMQFGGLVLAATSGMRPYGNLAQPNQLATLLLMGVILSIWLQLRGKIRLWQSLALVGWFSWGLTMAESRAAWLSALVLGSLMIWWGRPIWKVASWRVIGAWWLLLLGMRIVWTSMQSLLLLAPPIRPLQAIAQDNGRLLLWRQILAGIDQSPWVGYGWRQSVAGHKAGTAQLSSGALTDYSHNVVLDLMLWLGIPLAAILLTIIAWWLLRAVRRIENTRQLLLMASAVPIMVHSLVEFPFTYAYFLFPLGWMLGSLSCLQKQAHTPHTHGPVESVCLAHFWRIGVLGFSALCMWTAREYLEIEEDYRVLRFEMRNVGNTPQGYERPMPKLLTHLGALLTQGRVEPHRGMSSQELDDMKRLLRNYNWATLQVNYVIALALNQQVEQAKKEMKALEMHYGKASYEQARLYVHEKQEQFPELKLLSVALE